MIHELAHAAGIDDDRLHELGWAYPHGVPASLGDGLIGPRARRSRIRRAAIAGAQ